MIGIGKTLWRHSVRQLERWQIPERIRPKALLSVGSECAIDLTREAAQLVLVLPNYGVRVDEVISSVGKRIAAAEALRRHAPELKSELRKLMVAPSEKALSDFDTEHAKDLESILEFQSSGAEPFVPTILDENHFTRRGPSDEVRAVTGIFTKPAA